MTRHPSSIIIPAWSWIITLALLLGMAVLITLAQRHLSPTFDEQNHVTRGIAILRTGDFRLSLHHPPLANILEALPVVNHPAVYFSTAARGWREPFRIWEMAGETIWHDPPAGLDIIARARLPVLLFVIVLGITIFLWSRELFGPWGGVLAVALFALDPNFLAHGGLATTDLAAACTITLALYTLRKYLHQPSRGRLIWAGIAIGLAFAAKFSALILIPIVGIILLLHVWWPARATGDLLPSHPRRFAHAAGVGVLLLLISGITLWGSYGFSVEPLGAHPGQPLAANASTLERLPVPALQYLRGINVVMQEEHIAYLCGQTKTNGSWWYYFPVAFAVKTPLPTLLLVLGILVGICIPHVRRNITLPAAEWILLLAPVVIYAAAAFGLLGVSINLGIRHLLPLYPFLFILAGAWVMLLSRRRMLPWLLLPLCLWQGVTLARAYPDYLAFFNACAGGTSQGYHVLADSNYDWGQDLGALAALQQREGLPTLAFSYFGTTPPEAYGLRYTPLAGQGIMQAAPAPDLSEHNGLLAISVSNLVGGPALSGADYRPLLRLTPSYCIGNTIKIYHFHNFSR
jgi:hypothetical protein